MEYSEKEQQLLYRGLIPWGKGLGIRYAMMDLRYNAGHDYVNDSLNFLADNLNDLPDDLKSTKDALQSWMARGPIGVGESGTLYRCLRFYSWLLGEHRDFVTRGTLEHRIERGAICDNTEIVGWPEERLLQLDGGTSQWATASYIFRNNRRKVDSPPPKLKLTYDAVEHWDEQRARGKCWVPQRDDVLLRQAVSFIDILHAGRTDFVPREAEDAAYACAMGIMDSSEAARRFPSLSGHESDRTTSIREAIEASDAGEPICSQDHRVIQAVALRQRRQGKTAAEIKSGITYPENVSKSWPQFFTFLDYTYNI